MGPSTSTASEPEAISVNVQTGIRWSALAAGARFSAIKGQIKGGGTSNPHATTYSIAKKYLSGALSRKDVLKAARRVQNRNKRREVRFLLKNLMRMAPRVSGRSKSLPPPGRRRGPAGLVELKVSAQLFLEDDKDRYIGFWPNEVELGHRNARLYAQLMRESVQTSDHKPTAFEVYDLKRRQSYTFDVEELDEDTRDLVNFFATIEGDVKKARLH